MTVLKFRRRATIIDTEIKDRLENVQRVLQQLQDELRQDRTTLDHLISLWLVNPDEWRAINKLTRRVKRRLSAIDRGTVTQ